MRRSHRADALHAQGVDEYRKGRRPEGVDLLRRALRLDPANANAHFNLGVMLLEMGELGEAVASQRQAIACMPTYAEAWSSLSSALHKSGNSEEAIAAARRAVELAPHMVGAAMNLAVALRDLGDEAGALQAILALVQRNPESAEAWFQMAQALQGRGEAAGAIQGYERALALEPGHVLAHAQCALARLLLGDFARGWPEYEWRLRRPGYEVPEFPRPRWRGEELAGRTILVHTEQGLGDAIQMLRYLEPLAARAGHVIVEVDRALLPVVPKLPNLTAMNVGVVPPFDVVSPLLSLPLCFGTTLESVPGGAAYLEADADRVRAWEARLGPRGPERRVGVVWSGNLTYAQYRAVPFAALAPMLAVPDVSWFSLQNRRIEEEAGASGVNDLSEQLTDFGETAALIACMDLVITVDTSVAHLAGALGKPVWILLAFAADWRWALDRDDSPWYASARLFRQQKAGDWGAVIARVTDALRALPAPGRD